MAKTLLHSSVSKLTEIGCGGENPALSYIDRKQVLLAQWNGATQ